MMRRRRPHRIERSYAEWLRSPHTRQFISVISSAIVATLGALATAQPLQNNDPTGGATVDMRSCSDDSTVLCRQDSQCGAAGTCDSFNVVDLTVNLRFGASGWDPTAAEMDAIRAGFTAVSAAIYDASETQFLLGTVSLVRNNQAPDAAVQLSAGECIDNGSVLCTQNADCAGEGASGCDLGDASAPTRGWGSAGKIEVGIGCIQDPLCFTHQFFHFVGGVHDENEGLTACDQKDQEETNPRFVNFCDGGIFNNFYCEPPEDPDAITETQCQDEGGTCEQVQCLDPSGVYSECLMHLPDSPSNGELCVSANHDVAGITEQHKCHQKSCWQTLEENWPSVVLAPTSVPDPNQGQTPPIEPDFGEPATTKRVVVVIDRSGSMAIPSEIPTRIERGVNAVEDFVDLLSNGVEFGLVSFSDAQFGNPSGFDSTKDFPSELGLRAITETGDRVEAQEQARNLLERAEGRTNIGAGLRQAQDIMLEAGGQITANSKIILLTDGLNNEPLPDPQGDLASAIAELSIPVNVTCIGQGRNSTQCLDIASGTGGTFVDSVIEANLYDAFVEFVAEVEGSGVSGVTTAAIAEGDSVDIEVPVEQGVTQGRFVASWTEPVNDLDLQLFRPNGTQVPINQRIIGTQGEFYRIDTPETGTWTMRVQGTSVDLTEEFTTRVLLDNQALEFTSTLTRSVIAFPEAFTISANPTFGESIEGCEVRATVERPDGTTEEVELQDTGTAADGDAGDGLYGISYSNFTAGDGFYTFVVRARCGESDAAVFSPKESRVASTAFTTAAVPTFERVLRFSGLVTGVPENLPPIASICRNVSAECQGPTTPVLLDGTCSFDPEGSSLAYLWSSSTGTFSDESIETPTGFFSPGRHVAELVVTDDEGSISAPDTAIVTVTDTLGPVIFELVATPENLWPPNHRMVPVTLTVDVADQCDPGVFCEITSVTSDEPVDGRGDGHTDPDWEITGPLTVNLRSERSGDDDCDDDDGDDDDGDDDDGDDEDDDGGDDDDGSDDCDDDGDDGDDDDDGDEDCHGRTYTIEVTCSDITGFETTASTTVTVSHDQGH